MTKNDPFFIDDYYISPRAYQTKTDLLSSDLDDRFIFTKGPICMDFLTYENVYSVASDLENLLIPRTCEVLRENIPCKLYFDLEEVLSTPPPTNFNWLYSKFDKVHEAILAALNIDVSECLILENCRDVDDGYKMSFHIIYPDLVFEDQVRVGEFIKNLSADASLMLPSCVDLTVYKKFQLFRCMNCYKNVNDDAPLRLFQTKYSVDTSRYTTTDLFGLSLLTCVGASEIIEDKHVNHAPTPDVEMEQIEDLQFSPVVAPILEPNPRLTTDDQITNLEDSGMITLTEGMALKKAIEVVFSDFKLHADLRLQIRHSSHAHYISIESILPSGILCPVHKRVHEGRHSRMVSSCTFSFDLITMSYSIRCLVGGKISGVVLSTGRHVIDRERPNKKELWGIRKRNFITAFIQQTKNISDYHSRLAEELSWTCIKRGGKFYEYNPTEKLWGEVATLFDAINTCLKDKFRCLSRRQQLSDCQICQGNCEKYYFCKNGELGGSCFDFIRMPIINSLRPQIEIAPILTRRMERDEFNVDSCTLPIADQKVVDIRTGLVHDREGAHLYTKTLNTRLLSFDHEDVKEVHDMIRSAFNDESHFRMFYLSLGSMLFADSGYERCFYIWIGTGRNSKSVLAELLQEVLQTGFLYSSVQPSMFIKDTSNSSSAHSAGLISLQGARVCTVPEFVSSDRIDTAKIKSLSSGDTQSGRQMYTSSMTYFEPRCTIVIHTNELPQFGSDKAIIDRVRMVRFPVRFVDEPDENNPDEKKADHELIRRIKANPSAIMTCLVFYAKTYFNEYRSKGLTLHADWPKELKSEIKEELLDNIIEAAFDVGLIEHTLFECEFTDKNYLLQVLEDFAKKRSLRFNRSDVLNSFGMLTPDCRTSRKSVRVEGKVIKKTVITNIRITNSFMMPQTGNEGEMYVGKYQVSRNLLEAVGQSLKTEFNVSWKQKYKSWIESAETRGVLGSKPGCILIDRQVVDPKAENYYL
jgi:hypothetical protein